MRLTPKLLYSAPDKLDILVGKLIMSDIQAYAIKEERKVAEIGSNLSNIRMI